MEEGKFLTKKTNIVAKDFFISFTGRSPKALKDLEKLVSAFDSREAKDLAITYWCSNKVDCFGDLDDITRTTIPLCKAFVILITPEIYESEWCLNEYLAALKSHGTNHIYAVFTRGAEKAKDHGVWNPSHPLNINREEEVREALDLLFHKIAHRVDYSGSETDNNDLLGIIDNILLDVDMRKAASMKVYFSLKRFYEGERIRIKSEDLSSLYVERVLLDKDGISFNEEALLSRIHNGENLIITAPAGMGKSELLKDLKNKINGAEGRVPLLLPCSLLKTDEAPLRVLHHYFQGLCDFTLDPRRFQNLLSAKGKVTLLLDAYDEILREDERNAFEENLKKIVGAFPVNVVMTSRYVPSGLSGIPGVSFDELELLGFQEEAMRDYVRRLFQTIDEEGNVEAFEEELNDVGDEITGNPLFLSHLAFIYVVDHEIPHNKIEILEKMDSYLLAIDKSNAVRGQKQYVDPSLLKYLLPYLAYTQSYGKPSKNPIYDYLYEKEKNPKNIDEVELERLEETIRLYLEGRSIYVDGHFTLAILSDYYASLYLYQKCFLKNGTLIDEALLKEIGTKHGNSIELVSMLLLQLDKRLDEEALEKALPSFLPSFEEFDFLFETAENLAKGPLFVKEALRYLFVASLKHIYRPYADLLYYVSRYYLGEELLYAVVDLIEPYGLAAYSYVRDLLYIPFDFIRIEEVTLDLDLIHSYQKMLPKFGENYRNALNAYFYDENTSWLESYAEFTKSETNLRNRIHPFFWNLSCVACMRDSTRMGSSRLTFPFEDETSLFNMGEYTLEQKEWSGLLFVKTSELHFEDDTNALKRSKKLSVLCIDNDLLQNKKPGNESIQRHFQSLTLGNVRSLIFMRSSGLYGSIYSELPIEFTWSIGKNVHSFDVFIEEGYSVSTLTLGTSYLRNLQLPPCCEKIKIHVLSWDGINDVVVPSYWYLDSRFINSWFDTEVESNVPLLQFGEQRADIYYRKLGKGNHQPAIRRYKERYYCVEYIDDDQAYVAVLTSAALDRKTVRFPGSIIFLGEPIASACPFGWQPLDHRHGQRNILTGLILPEGYESMIDENLDDYPRLRTIRVEGRLEFDSFDLFNLPKQVQRIVFARVPKELRISSPLPDHAVDIIIEEEPLEGQRTSIRFDTPLMRGQEASFPYRLYMKENGVYKMRDVLSDCLEWEEDNQTTETEHFVMRWVVKNAGLPFRWLHHLMSGKEWDKRTVVTKVKIEEETFNLSTFEKELPWSASEETIKYNDIVFAKGAIQSNILRHLRLDVQGLIHLEEGAIDCPNLESISLNGLSIKAKPASYKNISSLRDVFVGKEYVLGSSGIDSKDILTDLGLPRDYYHIHNGVGYLGDEENPYQYACYCFDDRPYIPEIKFHDDMEEIAQGFFTSLKSVIGRAYLKRRSQLNSRGTFLEVFFSEEESLKDHPFRSLIECSIHPRGDEESVLIDDGDYVYDRRGNLYLLLGNDETVVPAQIVSTLDYENHNKPMTIHPRAFRFCKASKVTLLCKAKAEAPLEGCLPLKELTLGERVGFLQGLGDFPNLRFLSTRESMLGTLSFLPAIEMVHRLGPDTLDQDTAVAIQGRGLEKRFKKEGDILYRYLPEHGLLIVYSTHFDSQGQLMLPSIVNDPRCGAVHFFHGFLGNHRSASLLCLPNIDKEEVWFGFPYDDVDRFESLFLPEGFRADIIFRNNEYVDELSVENLPSYLGRLRHLPNADRIVELLPNGESQAPSRLDFSEESSLPLEEFWPIIRFGNEQFEEIAWNASITEIKEGSFARFAKIKRVSFLPGIKKLSACFNDCEGLQEINIPDSLDYLSPQAFLDCPNLKRVIVPSLFGDYFDHYSPISKKTLEDGRIEILFAE